MALSPPLYVHENLDFRGRCKVNSKYATPNVKYCTVPVLRCGEPRNRLHRCFLVLISVLGTVCNLQATVGYVSIVLVRSSSLCSPVSLELEFRLCITWDLQVTSIVETQTA